MNNKKLLALLIGTGLQISSAEAISLDSRLEHKACFETPAEETNFAITTVKYISSSNPFSNGCCGGSTCNGSCK